MQRRILVAAIGIPVGVFLIYLGDALLAALLGMIALLGTREFFMLAEGEGGRPFNTAGVALAASLPLLAHAERLQLLRLPDVAWVLLLLALLAASVWLRGPGSADNRSQPVTAVALTLFGVLYTGATITFAYSLRHHDYAVGPLAGTTLLLLPLLLTWTCDTAAYTVGRKMGRRKLMPTVSPGKTMEGAIAGVVFAIIVSVLYVNLVLRPFAQLGMSLISAIALGIGVSVAAQVGDLAESMMKRTAGVKDSSNLLPGHGGILDRFDSLYFVLPLAFWLLNSMLVPAPRLP